MTDYLVQINFDGDQAYTVVEEGIKAALTEALGFEFDGSGLGIWGGAERELFFYVGADVAPSQDAIRRVIKEAVPDVTALAVSVKKEGIYND